MEGDAEMDLSVGDSGTVWQRVRSVDGFTATSNHFVRAWGVVWTDVLGGLLYAAAPSADVDPDRLSFTRSLRNRPRRANPRVGKGKNVQLRSQACPPQDLAAAEVLNLGYRPGGSGE